MGACADEKALRLHLGDDSGLWPGPQAVFSRYFESAAPHLVRVASILSGPGAYIDKISSAMLGG